MEVLETRDMFAVLALDPIDDNTIFHSPPGTNESNGAGQYLFAGTAGAQSTSPARRALLKFDVSSLPAGATINSVKLSLTMSKSNSGAQSMTLHRLTSDWGEGSSDAGGQEGAGAMATTNDVTWRHRFFSQALWNQEGGDFLASPSATTSVGGVGRYQWSSPEMISDVQLWRQNGNQQFGWILRGNEVVSGSAKRFDSKENSTPNTRPKLEIDYTLPNSPPTDIVLDNLSISENALTSSAVTVGQFTATDASPQDAHVFALVTGEGGSDNSQFQIDGNRLRVKAGTLLDHERSPTLHVRVRATDLGGLSLEKSFTIQVADVNEPPVSAGPLDDQFLLTGEEFAFTIPAGQFLDPEDGTALLLSAKLADGSPLPGWLTFHAPSRTLAGIAHDADASMLDIRVTASDSGVPALHSAIGFRLTVVHNNRPWQNPVLELDADGDGVIAPIDALLIINELNTPVVSLPPQGTLPGPAGQQPTTWFDVNGDGFVSPIDVLLIINSLNNDEL